MLRLNWVKSATNEWLPLNFNLASVVPTTGVYVIWHSGVTPWTVRVGQGDIAARLGTHRNDTAIAAHSVKGGLFVTWAAVPALYLDGVERYLADQLQPLVGDRHPSVVPVPVNLPWAA